MDTKENIPHSIERDLFTVYLHVLDGNANINVIANDAFVTSGLYNREFIDFICNKTGEFVSKMIRNYEIQRETYLKNKAEKEEGEGEDNSKRNDEGEYEGNNEAEGKANSTE